jgi:hypothetical protein
LNKIYTVRLLRALMARAGLLEHAPTSGVVDVRQLEARVPPEEYRKNLRRIAEYGRAHDVPVLFLLLKDHPYYTRQIVRGIQYREQGDFQGAVRAFTLGLTNTVSGTLARKYLAATYEEMREFEKANAVGALERQLEPIDGLHPIYLDSDYNSIMLEVGKEYGVGVIDARAMLDSDTKVYIDMCHPDEVGHARLAELVFDAISESAPTLTKASTPSRISAR